MPLVLKNYGHYYISTALTFSLGEVWRGKDTYLENSGYYWGRCKILSHREYLTRSGSILVVTMERVSAVDM